MTKLGKLLRRRSGILVPLVEKFLIETGTDIQIISKSDAEIIKKLVDIQSKRQDERKGRTTFSGSSAAACMREQAIGFMKGYERPRISDPKAALIFDDGNWRSLKWTLVFNKMGLLVKTEDMSFNRKYNVSGTPDAELDLSGYYPEFDGLVGVEIKGMHTYEWKQFSVGEAISKWAIGRYLQCQAYMLITGRKFWIIWGENKNDQSFEENVIYRNSEIIRYLRRRYNYMLEARDQKILPHTECTFENSDPKFKWCGQKDNCQKLLKKRFPQMKRLKGQRQDDKMVMSEMLENNRD
jgi:hypothetical protein